MLAVLQPTRGIIYTLSQDELERQLAELGDKYTIIRTDNQPLPQSRNSLRKAGLTTKADYFLMLDDDVILPSGGIKAMIEALDKGADIAFCDYPYHLVRDGKMTGVTVWHKMKKDRGTGEVAWSGLGCVMCKRKVLEELEFRLSEYRFKRVEGELKMAVDEQGQAFQSNPNTTAGEDTAFFLDARAKKYKIKYVGLVASHLRIDKFVYRLSGGRFQTCHTIQVNDHVDRPEV